MRHIFSFLTLVVVVVAITACSSPPYVHNAGEFNREAADFGRPVTDIDSVTICYSSYSATPRQVTQMAIDECARFNKTAKFDEQNYETCPMVAPTAAVFNCLGGGNAGVDRQGIPSGTLMNYDGIPFRY